jgi:hypothetical protein
MRGYVALPPVSFCGVGDETGADKDLRIDPRGNATSIAWAGQALPGIICSVSHDSLHHELSLIGTCLGGYRGKIWITNMRPWRQTGHCHNEEPVSSS